MPAITGLGQRVRCGPALTQRQKHAAEAETG